MYSNSVKRNPIFQAKRAPKLGNENFAVGSVTEPTLYDTIPKQIHRTKKVQQTYDIRNNTSRTVLQYRESMNYEKNANLNLFSDINKNNNKNSNECPEPTIHRRTFYNPPLMSNNTTQETDKPRIIKEHIGATNNHFPTTRNGQELLKQQALKNMSEFPSMMKSLINSVKDLKQIRNTNDDDNTEAPEIVQNNNVTPTSTDSPPILPSTPGIVNDPPNTNDETNITEKDEETKNMYVKTLKDLERISSRLRRSGKIDIDVINKLIDMNIITSEISSDMNLVQQSIEVYSELIQAELDEINEKSK